jgi:hypothetical protein
VDPSHPDRDTRFVYDHLKYCCSLPGPFPWPAIHAYFDGAFFVVTAGHKYVGIARELGVQTLRTIASLSSPVPESVKEVPRAELEREAEMAVVRDYHVYFFDGPLSPTQREEFERTVVTFLATLSSPLLVGADERIDDLAYPRDGECARFRAVLPVADRSWVSRYRAVATRFSADVRRIVSFQGARFGS